MAQSLHLEECQPGNAIQGRKNGPMAKSEDVEFSNKVVSDENSIEE